MRTTILTLGLVGLLPLSAQGVPSKRWALGVQQLAPSLEGFIKEAKTEPGNPGTNVDLQKDFGLTKDKAKPGGFIEYQGPRFGITLSTDTMEYLGEKSLSQDITIDGTTFPGNFRVASKVKLQGYDLNWTIRLYRWEQAWIGLDLGAHGWGLDIDARGEGQVTTPGGTITEVRSAKVTETLPIPQIGLSAGGHFLNERIVLKGSYHMLSHKGAKYTRIQGDARFYVLSWLGLRGYIDNQTFDVPKGSVQDDLELKLDRNGVGFGIVARW